MRSNNTVENREFARTLLKQLANPERVSERCAEHGPYQSTVTRINGGVNRSECPECFKIKQLQRDAEERREFERENQATRAKAEQRRIEEKTGAAMIPKRFQGKRFEDYHADSEGQQRVLSSCIDYAHNFAENLDAGRCMILSGKVGTGKTHLAASIAGYLLHETEHTVVFRSLFGILQSIKNTYGEGAEVSEAEVFEVLTTPDLLIIDEIGATKTTEFELATLFALVNARYEAQLPSIIITNLGTKDLGASIGDRTLDRLREGGGRALVFDWESKRSRL